MYVCDSSSGSEASPKGRMGSYLLIIYFNISSINFYINCCGRMSYIQFILHLIQCVVYWKWEQCHHWIPDHKAVCKFPLISISGEVFIIQYAVSKNHKGEKGQALSHTGYFKLLLDFSAFHVIMCCFIKLTNYLLWHPIVLQTFSNK